MDYPAAGDFSLAQDHWAELRQWTINPNAVHLLRLCSETIVLTTLQYQQARHTLAGMRIVAGQGIMNHLAPTVVGREEKFRMQLLAPWRYSLYNHGQALPWDQYSRQMFPEQATLIIFSRAYIYVWGVPMAKPAFIIFRWL